MPKDKVNYRARGPRTDNTSNSSRRANDGGLRIEKWTVSFNRTRYE